MSKPVRLSLLLLALGCGDEPATPDVVDFERICGTRGPVPLLDLAENEDLIYVGPAGNDEFRVESVIVTTTTGTIADPRMVDACGESERTTKFRILDDPDWKSRPIACMDSDLVELDAERERIDRVLARRGCSSEMIAGVIITHDAAPGSTVGRLVTIRPDRDGAIVETLLPEVLLESTTDSQYTRVVGDRIFERTLDAALISVDPRTGETTLEVEEVAGGYVVVPGRVLYRLPSDVIEGEPGALLLRDLERGTDVVVMEEVTTVWFPVTDGVFRVPSFEHNTVHWFRVEDGSEIVPPSPGVEILGVTPGGPVWLKRVDPWGRTGTTFFRWLPGEEPRAVMSCLNCNASVSRGVLQILDASERRLFLARAEDGIAFELAAPVDRYFYRTDDDRVFTVLDATDGQGTFVVHVEGVAKTIATNVSEFGLMPWTGSHNEVFFLQPNPDGTQTLYRSRLAYE